MILSIALLMMAAPEQPSTATQPAKDPRQKMRCIRYTEIGSLAKTVKRCHTMEEWQKIRETAQGDLLEVTKPSLASSNGQ